MSETSQQRGAHARLYGRSKGKALRKRQAALIDELLPRLSLDLAQPPAPTARRKAPRDRLWRRRASDCGGARQPRGRLHRLRALPQRRGEAPRPDRRAWTDEYPPASRRRRRCARLAAGGRACRASIFSILTPGPSDATARGASSRGKISTGWRGRCMRARSCALRRISTITPPGPWRGCARTRAFRWRAQRAEDWRTPWQAGRRTKYEAKAMAEGRDPVYLTFVRALR